MSSHLPPVVCMICGGFTGEIPLLPIAKTMPMSALSSMTPPCSCCCKCLHQKVDQCCRCSCCLEEPPAFKTPLPLCPLAPPTLLPLVCRLVVVTPFAAPQPPLVLLMLCHTLSTDASPPVCLLFASWLLFSPCCCTIASSQSLDTPPPPHNASLPLVHFSSLLRYKSAPIPLRQKNNT
jgi:hypothetical protein